MRFSVIQFCLFISYLLLSSVFPLSQISLVCVLLRDQVLHEIKTNVSKNTSKPVALNNISKHTRSVWVGTPCPSPEQQDHSVSIVREHVFDILRVIWRLSLLPRTWGRALL